MYFVDTNNIIYIYVYNAYVSFRNFFDLSIQCVHYSNCIASCTKIRPEIIMWTKIRHFIRKNTAFFSKLVTYLLNIGIFYLSKIQWLLDLSSKTNYFVEYYESTLYESLSHLTNVCNENLFQNNKDRILCEERGFVLMST